MESRTGAMTTFRHGYVLPTGGMHFAGFPIESLPIPKDALNNRRHIQRLGRNLFALGPMSERGRVSPAVLHGEAVNEVDLLRSLNFPHAACGSRTHGYRLTYQESRQMPVTWRHDCR